jgi:hypothetical protein
VVFIEKVPCYTYTLPCGYKYRTFVPLIADDADVCHVPCERCDDDHHISFKALVKHPPRNKSGKIIKDMKLAENVDEALRNDQIVWMHARHIPTKIIAATVGLDPRRVQQIVAESGIDAYALGCDYEQHRYTLMGEENGLGKLERIAIREALEIPADEREDRAIDASECDVSHGAPL